MFTTTRRIWCLSLAIMAFALMANGQLSSGSTAPDFVLPRLSDGQSTRLSGLLGKLTILYFWTPLLGERNQDLVKLNESYNRWWGRGLRVVGILAFPEDSANALEFVRKNTIGFDNVVASGSVLEDFRLGGEYPTVVVLGKERRVLRFEQGNFDVRSITASAEAQLGAEPLPPEFSREGESFRRPIRSSSGVRRPSPILQGLAGAGMNAVLPGLAGFAYANSDAKDCTVVGWGASAVGFYCVGLSYLIDSGSKPNNFLGPEDEASYDRTVKTESKVLLAMYGLNVLVGCIIGVIHAAR